MYWNAPNGRQIWSSDTKQLTYAHNMWDESRLGILRCISNSLKIDLVPTQYVKCGRMFQFIFLFFFFFFSCFFIHLDVENKCRSKRKKKCVWMKQSTNNKHRPTFLFQCVCFFFISFSVYGMRYLCALYYKIVCQMRKKSAIVVMYLH